MGNNIIGIWPGDFWGTSKDKIILVGAHWDTTKFSPGFDDNGSGLAVMLEVARSLTSSSCRPRYSVIFVAFDYEETGCQGSLEFIKSYLTPFILEAHGWPIFQGAFIMDSVANYNTSIYSQDLPPEWREVLPGFQQKLQVNHFKGDFLSAIYRRNPDRKLASLFSRHWSSSGGKVDIINGDHPHIEPYSILAGGLKLPGGVITADIINKEILDDNDSGLLDDLDTSSEKKANLPVQQKDDPSGFKMEPDMIGSDLVDIDKEPDEAILLFSSNFTTTTTPEPRTQVSTEASTDDSMVDSELDVDDPTGDTEEATIIPTEEEKTQRKVQDENHESSRVEEPEDMEEKQYVRITRQTNLNEMESRRSSDLSPELLDKGLELYDPKGFKLKLLTLDLPDKLPHVAVLARYVDFLRSDHARFWYLNDTSLPDESFPAILLTDTGKYLHNFVCTLALVTLESCLNLNLLIRRI